MPRKKRPATTLTPWEILQLCGRLERLVSEAGGDRSLTIPRVLESLQGWDTFALRQRLTDLLGDPSMGVTAWQEYRLLLRADQAVRTAVSALEAARASLQLAVDLLADRRDGIEYGVHTVLRPPPQENVEEKDHATRAP